MNEKKICKMNDEEMKNVAGGQENNSLAYEDTMTPVDIDKKYEDPGYIYLICPVCGGNLNIITTKGNSFSGVCPHCNNAFSITA